MSKKTNEMIEKLIDECEYLSDNHGLNPIKNICLEACIPCHKAMLSGKCKTMKEFYNENKNG